VLDAYDFKCRRPPHSGDGSDLEPADDVFVASARLSSRPFAPEMRRPSLRSGRSDEDPAGGGCRGGPIGHGPNETLGRGAMQSTTLTERSCRPGRFQP